MSVNQIDYTKTSPRFSVTNEKELNDALVYLNENGYVVIGDVMNQDEINANKELLWKFLENASNSVFKRD
ncbi:unnamed protein product, partial [Rotaria sp. Silwood1]